MEFIIFFVFFLFPLAVPILLVLLVLRGQGSNQDDFWMKELLELLAEGNVIFRDADGTIRIVNDTIYYSHFCTDRDTKRESIKFGNRGIVLLYENEDLIEVDFGQWKKNSGIEDREQWFAKMILSRVTCELRYAERVLIR